MQAAIIENGVCVNAIIVRALEDVPDCVALPDGFGIGDLHDGVQWSPGYNEEQLELDL